MNRLVAHRGDMKTYPENSVFALKNAVQLGFQYLELDVQLSKDLEPMVIHDKNLERTTGFDNNVWDLYASEIELIPLLYPKNIKNKDDQLCIPSLKRVIEHINAYSKINMFVEIKKESIEKFGLDTAVDRIIEVQRQANFSVIIISFLDSVINYVKAKQSVPTGYVLKKYNKNYYTKAEKMQPDYLFCNVKKINDPTALWEGPWKWVLYDITNPTFAYELLEQGVDLIETGDIVRLSNSEYFQ